MRLQSRRGALLVLAAFLMVVTMGVVVIVVDISRMYVQKNELQTAADAAALAGTLELMQGAPEQMIRDSAISFAAKNKAIGVSVGLASADIICGIWNETTKAYSGDSPNCGAFENAVTVTTRAPAKYSLPGFLGGDKVMSATARAFAAYIGATKCIKPWAIPYTRLTKLLQPLNLDTLRNIDSVDAANLRSMSEAERTFMLKIGAPPNSGNFGSLEIPVDDPSLKLAGANLYRHNIEQCNPTLIGPGDTIDTEPGGMNGPTKSGVESFCTTNGSYEKGSGNCYDQAGNLGIPVKAALWSQGTTKANGRFAVIVRQIVSFVLENMSSDVEITGHFLPYLTAGEITVTPTTLMTPILVK